MTVPLVSAFYLALIWGIMWALTIQFVPIAAYWAQKRTWFTVVIGVGIDLAIGFLAVQDAPTPLAAWQYQFAVIALSSVGIIGRSLVNEWDEHRKTNDDARNS